MAKSDKNVTIIKRKKVMAAGHHGGAWKVAYADFVTAMMAFFLLMWLLSVSDEETKLGLADYFSPSIPLFATRGGGDGPFAGSSMFSQVTLSQDETGQKGDPKSKDPAEGGEASLAEIENALKGASGDAVDADPLLEHIRTRVTDEGLIIEVFDLDGSPLFAGDGVAPTPIFDQLVSMIGRVLARTENQVAVTGHLASGGAGDAWRVSAERAQLARGLLSASGVAEGRLDRVTGKADRSPATDAAADSRNNRIEITLLRQFGP